MTKAPAFFREYGWMRVAAAFEPAAAAEMRTVIWRELAKRGIYADEPSTWTAERPTELQRLRKHAAFAAIGGPRLLAAIAQVLQGRPFDLPPDWGSLFLAFPSEQVWRLPTSGWHADANFLSALDPPRGVKTLALLGGVEPSCGGTLILEGSHVLVAAWLRAHPPAAGANSKAMRESLRQHPYLAALQTPGPERDRRARFMDRIEHWNSASLRVVEATGPAGDVILMHPLTLHAAAPNAGSAPRLMLSGGVTTDGWGWGNAI